MKRETSWRRHKNEMLKNWEGTKSTCPKHHPCPFFALYCICVSRERPVSHILGGTNKRKKGKNELRKEKGRRLVLASLFHP